MKRTLGYDKADHTNQITDYNVDFGGPIPRDRLRFYGSWRQDIRVRRLPQTPDQTELVARTGKVN